MTDDVDSYEPAIHYDRITAAWRLLLGDELHYGVFAAGTESLGEATAALTSAMITAARLEPGMRVLDVGCGTGAPARRLATEHGVEVLGITTSPVGVETATTSTDAAGLSDCVRFEVRDGTDNQLDDASFDRAWVLESSHLMPARDRLLQECSRVLRPGGRLVLCDIVRHRDIPFLEVRRRRADFQVLRAGFGSARMDSLARYCELAEAAGLDVDAVTDLTSATLPTFDRWRANAATHHDEVTELIGEDGLETFLHGTDILEGLWHDGTFGYGLISAEKPR